MRRSRWILLSAALALVLVAAWLWWMKPQKADMAAFAPADALLYLEANRPHAVVEAVTATGAWKAYEQAIGGPPTDSKRQWLQGFIAWTGIGPVESVILARAQVAVVVTDLGITEAGDTINLKSEGAILIETHTSESRIKQPFEQALKTLAEKTYGNPNNRTVTLNGTEFIEWIAPEGSRQIVGTVAGSLLIIGTSEQVVQNCLAVSQGRRPALKDDVELNRLRLQLEADRALSFGYVPAGNSARLLSLGIPFLFGRAPGDSQVQRLITDGATKIFGSLGWSSRPHLTGIEDRYLIALQPTVVARLKPAFSAAGVTSDLQRVLPEDVYSVTAYRFADPAGAWQSLKTAVSSQVDALSAIVFSSLLKAALLSYGIDDPERFLGAVKGELFTMRLDETADRSILIAGVRDRSTLLDLLKTAKLANTRPANDQRVQMFEDATGDLAASLSEESIVMGAPIDVRRYAEMRNASAAPSAESFKRLSFFASRSSTPNVVTYTNDQSRVHSFFVTLIATRGKAAVSAPSLEQSISGLPYSVTETTLGTGGLERTTRSPLGQFSSLLPLLFPEQPTGSNTPSQSR